MALPVLLSLVVFGIAGIALLLHVLGYSSTARLTDRDDAAAIWQDRYPDLPAGQIRVTADKSAALITGAWGSGLVWALGSDFVARPLLHGHFQVIEANDRVELRTDDLTAPKITLSLTAPEREAWRSALTERT